MTTPNSPLHWSPWCSSSDSPTYSPPTAGMIFSEQMQSHKARALCGASLVAQMVKSLPTRQETGFSPWVGKIPWRRKWQPTPVFLPGEFMDRRAWWAIVHGVRDSWTRLSENIFWFGLCNVLVAFWLNEWMSCPGLNANFFLIVYFNWRMIALQYWLGFCLITTWISHRYTYVPSLLNLPPTPTPSHSSRLSQSTSLGSLSHTANSHWLYTLHRVVYMLPCYSPSVPASPSTQVPACVHKSALYVCVSIAALQIAWSVPSS